MAPSYSKPGNNDRLCLHLTVNQGTITDCGAILQWTRELSKTVAPSYSEPGNNDRLWCHLTVNQGTMTICGTILQWTREIYKTVSTSYIEPGNFDWLWHNLTVTREQWQIVVPWYRLWHHFTECQRELVDMKIKHSRPLIHNHVPTNACDGMIGSALA